MDNFYNRYYDAKMNSKRSSCPASPSLLLPSEADRPPSEPSLATPEVCFASD
jgi:hypothetical protein